MITLSLCMIVKDEEEVLARCLDSVKDIVDEIVIVDTGSTDKTKEIAQQYTKKVYDFKWCDDFAKARNFSFSKATKEYIMWLDADDVILEGDRFKIKQLRKYLDKSTDIAMLKYNVGFDENGNVNFSYYRERILKRDKNYKWISPIHEVINLDGNIVYMDIAITHMKHTKNKIYDSKRNLSIFNKMLKEGMTLDARQQFYFARELYYNKKFKRAIKTFNIFLDNEEGWIENKIDACIDLANCYLEVNDINSALLSLTRSFAYDLPRAEICCKLGDIFFQSNAYDKAIYWYKQATKLDLDLSKGGFYNLDCYNFIPYIQLCLCYYNLNDIQNANKYNELAGQFKPNSSIYLNNKSFFNNLLKS